MFVPLQAVDEKSTGFIMLAFSVPDPATISPNVNTLLLPDPLQTAISLLSIYISVLFEQAPEIFPPESTFITALLGKYN